MDPGPGMDAGLGMDARIADAGMTFDAATRDPGELESGCGCVVAGGSNDRMHLGRSSRWACCLGVAADAPAQRTLVGRSSATTTPLARTQAAGTHARHRRTRGATFVGLPSHAEERTASRFARAEPCLERGRVGKAHVDEV